MKKLLLTFLAAMAGFLPLAAQNWAPFKMGRTPYFQAGDSIYSLRLTSVQVVGNDSVFEFNSRIVPTNNFSAISGCNGPFGGIAAARTVNNIFGNKMLKSSNGDYRFIFAPTDTFLLKPNAGIGDSWPFNGPAQLTATLNNRAYTIAGEIPDSTITFLLSNGQTIQIAKNFGLISSRSFLSFLQPEANQLIMYLKRLPEAGIGASLANIFQIYNFQPGDKFMHQYKYTTDWGILCEDKMTSTEVLSRYDSPFADSIVYSLKRRSLIQTFGQPNVPSSACSGSSGALLTDYSIISFVVTETTASPASHLAREYSSYSAANSIAEYNSGHYKSEYNNRWATRVSEGVYDSCTATFSYLLNTWEHHKSYAEGLGLIMDGSTDWPNSGTKLTAYIKGTETYGNWQPLVLSSEKELAIEPIQVYPNPFTNKLTISLPELQSGTAEMTLYNLQGQKIHASQINTSGHGDETELQLPDMPAGLYLLYVQQRNNSYSVKVQRQ